MELLDLMASRRSIRKYTDEEIPEEKLTKILQAALLAPTSMGKQPWEYYVIKDRELLQKLSKAKAHGGDAEQNVRDILGVQLPWRCVGIMALGMPAEEKEAYSLDELKWEKVHK